MKNLLYFVAFLLFISCSGKKDFEKIDNSASDFVNFEYLSGGSYSSDYKKVIYISDRNGANDVWVYDRDLEASELLIKSSKDITSAWYYNNAIIYYMDYIDNESQAVYEYDIAKKISKLVIGKVGYSVIDLKISDDDCELIYRDNSRDKRFFDLYRYNLKTGKKELIWEDKTLGTAVLLSKYKDKDGGDKVIFSNGNKIYIYDSFTKKEELLADVNNRIFIQSVDGKEIYFTSNFESNFRQGYKINILNKKITKVISSDWDILHIGRTFRGKGWFYTSKEDGKFVLHLSPDEFKTYKKILFGFESMLSIASVDRDEKHVIAKVITETEPPILFIGNIESKSYDRVTEIPDAIKDKNTVGSKVIKYKARDGIEITGYLYIPETKKPKNGFPVIIWVHGRPKTSFTTYYNPKIQFLLSQGYAVFAPDYRGSDHHGKIFYHLADVSGSNYWNKEQIFDLVDGKNYILKEKSDLDPNRVGIIGGSWGGYLTALALAITPDEFKVGVAAICPIDLYENAKAAIKQNGKNGAASNFIDLNLQKNILENLSPVTFAHQIKSPLLMIYGKKDWRFIEESVDKMKSEIIKNNGIFELRLYEDEGHNFSKKAQIDELLVLMRFLEDNL